MKTRCYKAVGKITNNNYYFISTKAEGELRNIYPIMENFYYAEEYVDNPFDEVDVVYYLGDKSQSPRLGLPCFSLEDIRKASKIDITMEAFDTEKIANFLELGQLIKVGDKEFYLDIKDGKVVGIPDPD